VRSAYVLRRRILKAILHPSSWRNHEPSDLMHVLCVALLCLKASRGVSQFVRQLNRLGLCEIPAELELTFDGRIAHRRARFRESADGMRIPRPLLRGQLVLR
jgi:hypothetical protein